MINKIGAERESKLYPVFILLRVIKLHSAVPETRAKTSLRGRLKEKGKKCLFIRCPLVVAQE
jgi:hypothetical protein